MAWSGAGPFNLHWWLRTCERSHHYHVGNVNWRFGACHLHLNLSMREPRWHKKNSFNGNEVCEPWGRNPNIYKSCKTIWWQIRSWHDQKGKHFLIHTKNVAILRLLDLLTTWVKCLGNRMYLNHRNDELHIFCMSSWKLTMTCNHTITPGSSNVKLQTRVIICISKRNGCNQRSPLCHAILNTRYTTQYARVVIC